MDQTLSQPEETKITLPLLNKETNSPRSNIELTELYQSPPDINKCLDHVKACQPYYPLIMKSGGINRCPCCNKEFVSSQRVAEAIPIPITFSYDYNELKDQIGNAAVLYFVQMEYYLLMFLSMLPMCLVLAIINGSDNSPAHEKINQRIGNSKGYHFIADIFSLGNLNRNKIGWYSVLNTINIIVLYLVWIQLCHRFNQACREKHKYERTPDKYTVLLENCPSTNATDFEKILEYCIGKLDQQISLITYTYHIPEYATIRAKITELKCRKRNIEGYRENYRNKHPNASEELINSQHPFWFSFLRCSPCIFQFLHRKKSTISTIRTIKF